MARFNTRATRRAAVSPIATTGERTATHEGATGYLRDDKSELFLLAVSNMVGTDTFYEQGDDRDDRYRHLVRKLAVEDPEWTARLLGWLRRGGNMRTASLVGAAEYVRARLDAVAPGHSRQVVDSVLRRADEPGEMLGYWTGRYGRALPKPVKRGVADAVRRLYDERSLLKYDTAAKGFRFGDVLNLVHARPADDKPWQGDLFKHALDRRHGRDTEIPESLTVLRAAAELSALPVPDRRAYVLDPSLVTVPGGLAGAGFTWERLAGWLQGPMDKAVWEAVIPSLGLMACLAEGTPVWLADGTTAPIEEVVARKLPVLSYDKAWDARPVKYGPGQEPRDMGVGNLVPTVPTDWLDAGVRSVWEVKFVSGRRMEATRDHRWMTRRRIGRQAWEWKTTLDLEVGDHVPMPLTAGFFGDTGDAWDGYFVGAMLGDGGMTGTTPEFHGNPDDGAVAFMYEYAAKHGCQVTEIPMPGLVRLRITDPRHGRNAVLDVLRDYEVWGKRVEVKSLPNRSFSREFWIGCLSGLIDTDGCVRRRRNKRGYLHGSVEFGVVSRRLAEQVSDALLRLGVPNLLRTRKLRKDGGFNHNFPVHMVEVNSVQAIVRLAELLDLRVSHKADLLHALGDEFRERRGKKTGTSEMHGYDSSVIMDRVVAIEAAGDKPTYCVTVEPSHLFVAHGIVTGNCVRNLRNFDEAGVSDEVAERVAARIADPAQVARSRMFPFRFWAAYKHTRSLRWGHALEKALNASLSNVPALPGRTLILIDRSPSMFPGYGYSTPNTSDISLAEQAAVFGAGLAVRAEAPTLVEFGMSSRRLEVPKGGSALRLMEEFGRINGTDIPSAVKKHYSGHDRIVIVTDEQTRPGWLPSNCHGQWGGMPETHIDDLVPAEVPVYMWNMAGYRAGAMPSGGGNRHAFGGLTDHSFRMIPLLEVGRSARWPWEA